jgi:hypothetical protein
VEVDGFALVQAKVSQLLGCISYLVFWINGKCRKRIWPRNCMNMMGNTERAAYRVTGPVVRHVVREFKKKASEKGDTSAPRYCMENN